MSIHLDQKQLINAQQMELAVHGPDGATHLILCTGVAELDIAACGAYTFCVGPVLTQRQFVGVIASGAISTIQGSNRQPSRNRHQAEQGANLVLLTADYDRESRQVRVKVQVSSLTDPGKLAISYHVSILAELPNH